MPALEQLEELVAQGSDFATRGLIPEASEAFDQALKIEPNEPTALYGRVFALRKLNQLDAAETALEDAVDRVGETANLLKEGGWLANARGDHERALGYFDAALRLDESDESAFTAKLSELRQLRRFPDAEKAIEDRIASFGSNTEILTHAGWLYDDLDDYEKALSWFDAALNIDPADAVALLWRATELRRLGRFDEAEKAIDAAASVHGETPDLVRERGWLHDAQSDYKRALEFFDTAVLNDPTDEVALQWKLIELRRLHRFDEAQKEIDEAIGRVADRAALLREQGWLYDAQLEHERALRSFEAALEIEPEDETAFRGKLTELRKLRRFNDAEKVLEEAGESAALLVERAWVYDDQRDYERALQSMEAALALDPRNETALRWRVTELRQLRRIDEAEKALDEATERVGETTALAIERAWLRHDEGDYEGALQSFEAALGLDPRDETALQWRVTELRQLRRIDEAEKALDDAVGRIGETLALLTERGWLAMDRDDADAALSAFRKAEKAAPELAQPLLDQLDALERKNRRHEAVTLAERLRKAFPDDLDVRSRLGWMYINQNDLNRARREFDVILAQDPTNPQALNGVGGVYFSHGDYALAEEYFRRAVDAGLAESTYYTNLAWALVRQDSSEKLSASEEVCKKALELNSENAQAVGCLGVIAYRRGSLREAEDYLKTSIEISPREGSYTDLGALYVKIGRYDAAEEYLRKAIEIDESDTQALIELGGLCLERKEHAKAVAELRHATALDPDNEDAARALAISLWQSGQPHDAERVLRDALRRLEEGKRARLHLTLSRILAERGDLSREPGYYNEALRHVAEAKLLNRDDPEPYFHSGVVRYKLEDYWGAWRDFRACLDRDPDDYEAERYAEKLRSIVIKGVIRSSFIGGIAIGVISFAQVVALWALYLTGRITDTVLATLLPIVLGLFVVAFLLPSLVRLKLPGIEAEVSGRREAISAGPTGDVSFAASDPVTGSASTIGAGPR